MIKIKKYQIIRYYFFDDKNFEYFIIIKFFNRR